MLSIKNVFSTNKSRKTVALATVVMIIVIVTVGTKTVLAAYNTRQLDKACHSYIAMIVRGDLDSAYEQSDQSIKDAQAVDLYKQKLSKLQTSNPQLEKKLVDVKVYAKLNGSCVINVDNLPASTGERTDGIFNMGAVKNNGKWKINSISVE